MGFPELGLSPALSTALASLGMTEPLPVQATAIPPALEGQDLLVLSPTGSGKTVAFAAPILEALSRGRGGGTLGSAGSAGSGVSALILVPTRELAIQVAEVVVGIVKALAAGTGPATSRTRVRVVHGGVSVNPQMLSLRGGAEILVATPGRLLDLARRNAIRLDSLRHLVLDEADRMLDAGFADELAAILALLPETRQTLLFSATFREATAALLSPALKNPLRLGTESMPEGTGLRITHRAYRVAPEGKGPLLRRLLSDGFASGMDRILVFTASNRRADNVTRKLSQNGIPALSLHGDLSQATRTQALADFRHGVVRVLVASDLAARGLDIQGLDCVVNYEFGRSALDYVHRAGRTGRAAVGAAEGLEGLVLSLVSPEDEAMLRLIRKRTGIAISLDDPAS